VVGVCGTVVARWRTLEANQCYVGYRQTSYVQTVVCVGMSKSQRGSRLKPKGRQGSDSGGNQSQPVQPERRGKVKGTRRGGGWECGVAR